MASHNEVNGLPMHANGPLLSALRNDFGFDGGLCASDAGDVASVAHFHVANDTRSAGVLAIKAGMDQELQFHGAAFPQLPSALAAGLVTQATIDRAVSNVLRQKFARYFLTYLLTYLLTDTNLPSFRPYLRTLTYAVGSSTTAPTYSTSTKRRWKLRSTHPRAAPSRDAPRRKASSSSATRRRCCHCEDWEARSKLSP